MADRLKKIDFTPSCFLYDHLQQAEHDPVFPVLPRSLFSVSYINFYLNPAAVVHTPKRPKRQEAGGQPDDRGIESPVTFLKTQDQTAMARINLRNMTINQSGVITAVKVGGELGRRIREMGLVPGTEITIKQRAPLNDPVALRVMDGTLTLRNNEADFIEVEIKN